MSVGAPPPCCCCCCARVLCACSGLWPNHSARARSRRPTQSPSCPPTHPPARPPTPPPRGTGPICMNALVPPRPRPLVWGVAASYCFLFAGFLLMVVSPGISLVLASTFVRAIGGWRVGVACARDRWVECGWVGGRVECGGVGVWSVGGWVWVHPQHASHTAPPPPHTHTHTHPHHHTHAQALPRCGSTLACSCTPPPHALPSPHHNHTHTHRHCHAGGLL